MIFAVRLHCHDSLQKSAASKMRFNISRTLDGPALPALARVIETHGGTM